MRSANLAATVLSVGALCSLSAAQANQDPDMDVALVGLQDMQVLGRIGSFPDGRNGVSLQTVLCNAGAIEIPWKGPMNPDHPMMAFLVARGASGRMEQISNRSYVKHGFSAANGTACGPCTPPIGEPSMALGIGCSDTYSVNTNGNRLFLGPAEEIDPWLGQWAAVCSHFDRGEPPVPPPADCDGERSLTLEQVSNLNPVTHRIEIEDEDLNVPGAKFFVQAHLIVATEPEHVRGDSLGSRRFGATWGGAQWNLQETGALQPGSLLERWAGAKVTSRTNGGDDGRVYVAVKVSGPTAGMYHYEYAIHNRDNARGVGAVHIPVCRSARVRNVGFRDIDADGTNDWTVSVGANQVTFSTASAPLEWNTFYNFWFDSDAAPAKGALSLDAFTPGVGSPSFTVPTSTPTGLFVVYLGNGCASDRGPSLHAAGNPARPLLGNASFALESSDNVPQRMSVLLAGTGPEIRTRDGCTLWTGRLLRSFAATVDASGVAVHPLPIPADPWLEGLEIDVQSMTHVPMGLETDGPVLSAGLRLRIGNAGAGCPRRSAK